MTGWHSLSKGLVPAIHGYIETMKRRDPMLAKGWEQIVTPLFVQPPESRD